MTTKEVVILAGWSQHFNKNILTQTYQVHTDYERNTVQQLCAKQMLHGSETWPVRKENVVALQRAEMRMVRWMCGVKLKDRFPSKELRERLGINDIALVLQQSRLWWYGHVLWKDDDWVKKWMVYEIQGPIPRGHGQRLSKRTVKHVNWIKRMLWIIVNGGSW